MEVSRYKEICSYLQGIIKGTEYENRLYCVGGCVRDYVMGSKSIKDIDVVLDIRNGGIKFAKYLYEHNLLNHEPVIYERFGTAMFQLKEYPDEEIEAVHTRSEKYNDINSRKPDQDFGTLEDDCMRRDLTINALYYNISTCEITDLTKKGLDDIKNHIIQTPCNPVDTYNDDPLRMLRCIRFSTRYDWKISDDTLNAIRMMADRINIISRERIHDEILKIFSDKNYLHGVNLLDDCGFLKIFDIDKRNYNVDLLNQCDNIFQVLLDHDNVPYMIVMSCLLYMDGVNALLTQEDVLRELKFTVDEIKYNRELNSDLKYILDCTKTNNSTYAYNNFIYHSKHIFESLCYALFCIGGKVDEVESMRYINQLLGIANRYHKESLGITYHNYKMPVNGNEIMELCGIKEGRKIKEYIDKTLSFLFENVAAKDATKEKCIEIIKRLNNE